MIKGQIISGSFGNLLMRQKSGQTVELGELLVAETPFGKVLLQVYDLLYGSQVSQQNLELIAGMDLEDAARFEFMDPAMRNYVLASLKTLITIGNGKAQTAKQLPSFFSTVRTVSQEDLSFLGKPEHSLCVGNLRSGSNDIGVTVYLPGDKVFAHHILIAGTTGRGKSVLLSNLLWDVTGKEYCGMLVLDPHDEYYGRTGLGLKDHPSSEKVVYYTPNTPPAGARTLKINLEGIRPHHFSGVVEWTQAQSEALMAYWKSYGKEWINSVILERKVLGFNEATIAVVRRRLLQILNLSFDGQQLFADGIFSLNAGSTTVKDICHELEEGNTVIIDTSSFSGSTELLIGSLVASEVLDQYKYYKMQGTLSEKPVISILLEEAPRVLSKEVLDAGPNVFATIAKEGRKFKVGLTAVTQLPSLIPRQILANMNTKIILGIEMAPERQAIVDSAAQDLSNDHRAIASLDIGEAIITSTFARFALPIKVPFFDDVAKKSMAGKTRNSFSEVVS